MKLDSRWMKNFAALTLIALLISLTACGRPTEPTEADTDEADEVEIEVAIEFELTEETIRRNNRGVGLMGRYQYDQAREIFLELAEAHPEWLDVQVNLAIATLNRQNEGDERRAMEILESVLERDPEHLRARYCTGLLMLYLDRPDEAREAFKLVALRVPEDPHAAYYVGQTFLQARQLGEARKWFERAIEHDPYLRSAYYGLFLANRQLDRMDEAERKLEMFERLDANPRAVSVDFIYTRMGRFGEAKAVDLPREEQPPRPDGPPFADAQPFVLANAEELHEVVMWIAPTREQRISITAVDLTGNDRIDLMIPSVLRSEVHRDLHNAVLINEGDGTFSLDIEHPLARIDRVNAVAWGDYDNDGLTDAYLLRDGPNQLWRQTEGNTWRDVTEVTGTAGGAHNSVDGMFIDADHTGTLDLWIANADGPNELLNNNYDGTFRPLALEQGLAGDHARPSRQVMALDLEQDRDLDLIVWKRSPPHEVYLNDRLWRYNEAGDPFREMRQTAVVAAASADRNADGQKEIYTLSPAGHIHRWQPDDERIWRGERIFWLTEHDEAPPGPTRTQLAVADITGDGELELIVATERGWLALHIDENDRAQVVAREQEGGLIGWTLALLEPELGPAVVGLRVDEAGSLTPKVWNAGPGRYEFAALSFTGREDAGQSMRSNASGIGTYFAVRVGSQWTAGSILRHDAGPGQSLQPFAVGLGGAAQIDFVHIDWSDGIFQSEVELAAGESHTITETQRQLSSCPVLFVWDGEKYDFVSDVLGVGGIGFSAGPPGEFIPSRPWERFLMPEGVMQPRNGRYALKLAEPMEEACYLDSAKLHAYDLPPGWHMTVDDRMNIHGPEPTGEARFYRETLHPARVKNDRGEDVTEIVRQANHRAAPIGPREPRFIGMLKNEHVLTLEFDRPIDSGPGKPTLVADGWVEYPYSQTNFAAWQAGEQYHAPTIEAQGESGEWSVILKEFGYPAGMPREMSVELPDLPENTTRLRIRTNQEIYWDRLMIAYIEPLEQVRRTTMPLRTAILSRSGFAQRVELPQKLPYYDYRNRLPLWDTRHQAGFYTAYGPVEKMIREPNDALAIFGPGEEIHMEFEITTPRLEAGWSRRYVFEVHGWCKDMDLFTRDGETLAPLPSRQEDTTERDRLHERFNTRYRSGR
ncbi:MAG: hypothetical protein EA377_03590 [Phycisphaerales bacterium]|nr:MAG: hypothetical protein EA377_03590 [Phycisphaerales bacterium]